MTKFVPMTVAMASVSGTISSQLKSNEIFGVFQGICESINSGDSKQGRKPRLKPSPNGFRADSA